MKEEIKYSSLHYPILVGWYIIGGLMGLRIPIYERPSDEHIKNMKELLGIEWKDNEQTK